MELNFGKQPPQPKCRHCGRDKWSHKAETFNCPIGRGRFPQFNMLQHFEPRTRRTKQSPVEE